MSENIFRPVYRELSEEEKAQMSTIKDAAHLLYEQIMATPESRERSIAITNLEQAVMWAVKGVTK